MNIIINTQLCSCSKPCNFILFASCWAFFFKRHALEASLFFSLRVFGLAVNGNSETGVISLIIRDNLSNSRPILYNFRGFGVRSFPSPFRAFPLCLIPRSAQWGLKTGSVASFKICGSSRRVLATNLCPFGPFAWTLYCQKYRSFLLCLLSRFESRLPPPPLLPLCWSSPSLPPVSIQKYFIVFYTLLLIWRYIKLRIFKRKRILKNYLIIYL